MYIRTHIRGNNALSTYICMYIYMYVNTRTHGGNNSLSTYMLRELLLPMYIIYIHILYVYICECIYKNTHT